MPFPAGKKFGPYELVALLGAGGMGEVYRARDPRIGRDVALKILPSEFCADPDRLQRFTHEAKAAGILNHSNIVAIYDVGTDNGTPYLVTELLEGETLRELLRGGALPLRQAIDYAIQMAEGLARAHSKGIIHRDLKPENIFIGKEGGLKILDFGLAKLTVPESQHSPLDASATAPVATQPGVVMGSAGYMSPEQLRGITVDHRSDIFNFGAILYEMLSGNRAFQRDTFADTTTAILKEDPPELTTLNPGIRGLLGRLVPHCLEKNAEDRYQSVRDLSFDLKCLLTDLKTPSGANAASAIEGEPALAGKFRPNIALQLASVAALMLLAAMLGWWVARRSGISAPREPVKIQRLTDFRGMEEFPAVSPDGKSLAFTADITGSRQIWVRLIAGGSPLQLTHDSADHVSPRWFADLASILYYTPPGAGEAQGTLSEISALGGTPRRLASSVSEGDVSHDGTKLAFFRLNEGHTELVVTDRDGSGARVLYSADQKRRFVQPRWSPDDQRVAFEETSAIWAFDVYVIPVTGGEPRPITTEAQLISGFAWLPDGSGIIYSSARGSTFLYLPVMSLWLARLRGGNPQKLTFDEATYEQPDIDRQGKIFTSRRHMQFDLWKFPVNGNPSENVRNAIRLTRQTGHVQTPTASPDDREVAFLSDSGGHGNIWVMKLDNGELRQITFERDPLVTIGVPIWSPDGAHIAFASTRSIGSWNDVGYWLVSPDGSNLRNVVKQGSWATWSGDSRWIYYTDLSARTGQHEHLLKQAIDGGAPVIVRTDQSNAPAVAWDGSAVYYVVPLQGVNGLTDYEIREAKPESGPSQVLARIPGVRIPIWQGLQPVLSHDGKWLALPLNDSLGTNIWLLPTAGGMLRQITVFGQMRSFIARRLSWSADDHYIYAALGEGDADIVALDGLVP